MEIINKYPIFSFSLLAISMCFCSCDRKKNISPEPEIEIIDSVAAHGTIQKFYIAATGDAQQGNITLVDNLDRHFSSNAGATGDTLFADYTFQRPVDSSGHKRAFMRNELKVVTENGLIYVDFVNPNTIPFIHITYRFSHNGSTKPMPATADFFSTNYTILRARLGGAADVNYSEADTSSMNQAAEQLTWAFIAAETNMFNGAEIELK